MAKDEGDRNIEKAKTKSVAFRLDVKLIQQMDVMAARAAVQRIDVLKALLEDEPLPNTPVIACLGQLLRLHHRLDRNGSLDALLRDRIAVLVDDLTKLAHLEIDQ